MTTETQFDAAVGECRSIFQAKFVEYGPSWRFLRVSALCDRIFTKAARIRRLESLGGTGKIEDTIESEFAGIVNYAVIVLDRLDHEGLAWPELSAPVPDRWSSPERAGESYDRVVTDAKDLMIRKNHDYDEAWRHILLTTFTDEIISRTLRMRELLQAADEDVDAVKSQLLDTLNYSTLALIRLRGEAAGAEA